MNPAPPTQLEPLGPESYSQPPRKRPLGVTLIALLFLWIGGFGTLVFPLFVLAGLATKQGPSLLSSVIHSHALAVFISSLFALIWYSVYVAYLFIGIGLWRLRNWARKAVIGISIFCMVAFVAIVIPLTWKLPYVMLPMLIGMALPVGWQIWYLQRPRVRFAFGALPALPIISGPPPRPAKHSGLWIAAAVVVAFALFCGSLFYEIGSLFHSSDVYKLALAGIQASPCVATRLGTPIVPGWNINGSLNEEGSQSGQAAFNFHIRGSRGEGEIELEAKKRNGSWNITSLTLLQGDEASQITPGLPEVCK